MILIITCIAVLFRNAVFFQPRPYSESAYPPYNSEHLCSKRKQKINSNQFCETFCPCIEYCEMAKPALYLPQ